ncbi:hypothetical protein H4W33_003116 [Kibdelosporangium phytohabitans]|nr:hypothetical protein [Kibdelosporangium phytohabitans]
MRRQTRDSARCVQALRALPHDPTVNGLECVPTNGKHYIEVSHTD